ncbi:hypothetical protein BDW72DRAFT_120428 [Aspergillus terricola var. indicus]
MLELRALMGVRHSTYIHTDLPLMNVQILLRPFFSLLASKIGARPTYYLLITYLFLVHLGARDCVHRVVVLFFKTYIFNEHEVLVSPFYLFPL